MIDPITFSGILAIREWITTLIQANVLWTSNQLPHLLLCVSIDSLTSLFWILISLYPLVSTGTSDLFLYYISLFLFLSTAYAVIFYIPMSKCRTNQYHPLERIFWTLLEISLVGSRTGVDNIHLYLYPKFPNRHLYGKLRNIVPSDLYCSLSNVKI